MSGPVWNAGQGGTKGINVTDQQGGTKGISVTDQARPYLIAAPGGMDEVMGTLAELLRKGGVRHTVIPCNWDGGVIADAAEELLRMPFVMSGEVSVAYFIHAGRFENRVRELADTLAYYFKNRVEIFVFVLADELDKSPTALKCMLQNLYSIEHELNDFPLFLLSNRIMVSHAFSNGMVSDAIEPDPAFGCGVRAAALLMKLAVLTDSILTDYKICQDIARTTPYDSVFMANDNVVRYNAGEIFGRLTNEGRWATLGYIGFEQRMELIQAQAGVTMINGIINNDNNSQKLANNDNDNDNDIYSVNTDAQFQNMLGFPNIRPPRLTPSDFYPILPALKPYIRHSPTNERLLTALYGDSLARLNESCVCAVSEPDFSRLDAALITRAVTYGLAGAEQFMADLLRERAEESERGARDAKMRLLNWLQQVTPVYRSDLKGKPRQFTGGKAPLGEALLRVYIEYRERAALEEGRRGAWRAVYNGFTERGLSRRIIDALSEYKKRMEGRLLGHTDDNPIETLNLEQAYGELFQSILPQTPLNTFWERLLHKAADGLDFEDDFNTFFQQHLRPMIPQSFAEDCKLRLGGLETLMGGFTRRRFCAATTDRLLNSYRAAVLFGGGAYDFTPLSNRLKSVFNDAVYVEDSEGQGLSMLMIAGRFATDGLYFAELYAKLDETVEAAGYSENQAQQ